MNFISRQGALTIFGIFSFGLNINLLYHKIDDAVTISYMEDGMKHKYAQLADCKMLLMPSHQKIGHRDFIQISRKAGLEIMDKGINEQHNTIQKCTLVSCFLSFLIRMISY